MYACVRGKYIFWLQIQLLIMAENGEVNHELESVSSSSTLSMGSLAEEQGIIEVEQSMTNEEHVIAPELVKKWMDEIKVIQDWESQHGDIRQAIEQTKLVLEQWNKYLESLGNQENTQK